MLIWRVILLRIEGIYKDLNNKIRGFSISWLGWKVKVIEYYKKINSYRNLGNKMIMKLFKIKLIIKEKGASAHKNMLKKI